MAISAETNERLVEAIKKLSSEVGAKTESSKETILVFKEIMDDAIKESAGESGLSEADVISRTTSFNRLPAFPGIPNVNLETAIENRQVGAAIVYSMFRPSTLPPGFPEGPIIFESGNMTMSILNIDGSLTEGATSVSANRGEIYSFAKSSASDTIIEVTRIR